MNRPTLLAALSLSLAVVSPITAGPLTPPVGPIASTHKTLSEVEPRIPIDATNTPGTATASFRITQPGSYYLTGNITGASGKAGIEVNTNNVTIDLGGYTLQGVAGSLAGITHTAAVTQAVTVRNGIVRDWAGSGVDLAVSNDVSGSLIENILAVANGSFGIRCGRGGIIRNCTATDHTGASSFAFVAYNESIIESCTANANRVGYSVGINSRVTNCSATSNSSLGFTLQGGIVFTNCISAANQGSGFNQSGSGAGLTYIHCQALNNASDGFSVQSAVFLECTASGNGTVGTTGAGIRISNIDARVDGCTLVGNDLGLVATGGCLIVRNSASGNTTKFSLTGTNTVGPIITATGTITSTNPWANFEY